MKIVLAEFYHLFIKLNFDFRFRCFQHPVSEKTAHFRFEIGTGNQKVDDANTYTLKVFIDLPLNIRTLVGVRKSKHVRTDLLISIA